MRASTSKTYTILACTALAATVLAGCANDDIPQSADAPAAAASPSIAPPAPQPSTAPNSPHPAPAAASPSSFVGGNPGTWEPVVVTVADNNTTITLVPHQSVIITGLNPLGTTIASSDPTVVDTFDPTLTTDGSTNGAVQALTPGVAVVTVAHNNITAFAFTVRVVDDPDQTAPNPAVSDPSAPTPTAQATMIDMQSNINAGPFPLTDAVSMIERNGLTYRIVAINGVPQAATMDYRNTRLNLAVEGVEGSEIVVGVTIG